VEHGLGVQARHDHIGAVGLYATRRRERLASLREDRVGQSSLALYYQGEWALTDRLRGTAGLRGDVYRFAVRNTAPDNSGTETAGVLSPKLGVAYAPIRTLELYGNFGYGYHSNDARGILLSVDAATPLVRTRGSEAGVRTVFIPRLQTTVSVWALNVDSELLFVGDAGATEAGRPSRRAGVEWANHYSPRPWLTVDGDLALSSARFTDPSPLGSSIPGAVDRVASLGVSLGEVRGWAAGVRLRHIGPRTLVEDASATSAGSLLVNAEAGYRLAPRTRLLVDVLNLTNARASDVEYYYASRLPGEPAGGVDDIHLHPVAPRTVRLSVQFDF
jgi:outer membrane receptor protein involved in Fe transport